MSMTSICSAAHPELSKLPQQIINFSVIDNHKIQKLVKGEFETTAKFEQRKLKNKPKTEPHMIYIESQSPQSTPKWRK